MLLILIQICIIYLSHSLFILQSKVIRVLNLWQKNQVFPPEVVQPLFDLADPNHSIHKDPAIAAIAAAAAAAATTSNGLASTPTKGTFRIISPCVFYSVLIFFLSLVHEILLAYFNKLL